MARGLAVSAVQLKVTNNDVERNLKAMRGYIGYVSRTFDWIDLIVFPELAVSGHATNKMGEVAVTASESDPVLSVFCEAAAKHRKWIVPGSMYEREGDRIYNAAFVISPAGEIIRRYRKMFPWYPYERALPGPLDFCVVEIPGKGRIGIEICYDVWLPEIARKLAILGAEAIIHPSMTSTPDRRQELILGPAAAIANHLYFVDVNCTGEGGNGRSQIVDPEGNNVLDAGEAEIVLNHYLDFEHVERVRRNGTAGTNRILRQLLTTELAPSEGGAFNGLEPMDVPRAPTNS